MQCNKQVVGIGLPYWAVKQSIYKHGRLAVIVRPKRSLSSENCLRKSIVRNGIFALNFRNSVWTDQNNFVLSAFWSAISLCRQMQCMSKFQMMCNSIHAIWEFKVKVRDTFSTIPLLSEIYSCLSISVGKLQLHSPNFFNSRRRWSWWSSGPNVFLLALLYAMQ